jgi:hypothetical protein
MRAHEIPELVATAKGRFEFWTRFVNKVGARSVVEIGVWRGAFAEAVLRECPSVERYYMIDPWRHLADWNKPANKTDEVFDGVLAEAMERTDFAADRRIILRGRTSEVIGEIPDASLDFAYIDGDHSLRGITLDLQLVVQKMAPGAWIGGDDFVPHVWQHGKEFEPTFVFPCAVYFAEALSTQIFAVGSEQFLMRAPPGDPDADPGLQLDRSGRYSSTTVGSALTTPANKRRTVRGRLQRVLAARDKPDQ